MLGTENVIGPHTYVSIPLPVQYSANWYSNCDSIYCAALIIFSTWSSKNEFIAFNNGEEIGSKRLRGLLKNTRVTYLKERGKKTFKISGELAQSASLPLGITVSTDFN